MALIAVGVAAVLLGRHPMARGQAASSAALPVTSRGGIPIWPWSPGGIDYVRPGFSAIPFPVRTVSDSSMPRGQMEVLVPGVEGTSFSAGTVKVVVTPPKPETVAEGTAIVRILSVHGVRYAYDRVLPMLTTAYNGSVGMNGPWGAVAAWNGQPLKFGDVAVDPHVIPLGTYLYIDGYGPARAVDTGSAIQGDHIDLFFNEANWRVALYGVQFHKVYVLTGPPAGFHG